jgi:molybdenum cofactor cytidylyltransferase
MIEAIILAAGQSTRMGEENKMLLPYRESTLLNQVIKEVYASKVDRIIVVTGHQAAAIEQSVSNEFDEIIFVHNAKYESGQTSSIAAGIMSTSPLADAAMIMLGDMPMITSFHYDDLIDVFNNANEKEDGLIMRPIYKDFIGHPIFFDKRFFDMLITCDNPNGCKAVIDMNKQYFRPIPVSELRYFFDIDTPADYQRVLRTIEEKSQYD